MRILFFLLFPIFLSAQINRAYGVIEIGATFPTSSSTGPKFAYRTVDSSFYRWVTGNTWVKVVNPSIQSDTLYLTQTSGTTVKVNGDTINLVPYLLKSDTTSMLSSYINLAGWGLSKLTKTLRVDSSKVATRFYVQNIFLAKADTASMLASYPNIAGYGIIDEGKTWRADTTSPNGLATRKYTLLNPTSIIADRSIRSNGTNLVAGSWDDNLTRLLARVPVQFQSWTTAGRPTGVSGYIGDNNTNDWIERYSSTAGAWISPLQSSLAGGSGTATNVVYLDGNGRATATNGLKYVDASKKLNVGTVHIEQRGTEMRIFNESFGDINFFTQGEPFVFGIRNNRITFNAPPFFQYSQILGSFNANLFNLQLVLSGTQGAGTSATVSNIRPTGTVTLAANSFLNFFGVDATAITASGAGKKVAAFFKGGGVVIGNNVDPVEDFRVIGDTWIEDSLRLSQASLASKILQTDANGWVKPLVLSGMDYTGGTLRANSIYNLLPVQDVTVTQATPDTFKLGLDGTLDVLGEDRKETKYGGINPLFGQGTIGAAMTVGREGYWAEKGAGTDSIQTPLSLFAGNTFRGDGFGMELALGGFRNLGTGKKYSGYAGLQWFTDYFNSSRAYIRLKDADNSGNFYYTNFRRGSVLAVSLSKYNMAYDANQYDIPGIPSNSIIAENFISVGGGLYPTKRFTVYNNAGTERASIDSSGIMRLNTYGQGSREATDLSKTQSNYIAGFATDGTVLDLERKRDTTIYIDDTDYNWSTAITTAQIASRFNRVVFWMTTTGVTGSDSEITLHTPDVNLMQVEYIIHSVDEAGGFSNVIRFGTNNAVDSTNGLVSSYFPAAGQGVHVRAGLRSAVYKYRYY